MNGFGRLLKNELIKIWKQLGYRILLFILIGITLSIPVFSRLTSGDYSTNAQEQYDIMMEIAKDKTSSDKLNNEFYIARAKSFEFFIENDLSDDWKFTYFNTDHENYFMSVYALKLIEDNTYTEDEILNSSFCSYVIKYNDYSDDSSYSKSTDISETPKTKIYSYAEAVELLEIFEKRILESTEKSVTKTSLDGQTITVSTMQIAFDQAKAQYELNPSNDIYEYSYKLSELKLKSAKYMLAGWQSAYDNSASPVGWQYSLLNGTLHRTLTMLESCVPISETNYNDQKRPSDPTYSQYAKSVQKEYDYYLEAVNVYLYSLENDIMIPSNGTSFLNDFILRSGISEVSTKLQIKESINSFVSMLTVLMIVLASGIISSEFSSGSVRLLLIRPRSRLQIIMSKFACVGVIIGVFTVVMSIILALENLLLFGITDAFTNDIVVFGGEIIEMPSIIGMIGNIAVAVLPVLLLVSLTTLIAVLSKKNGLAITLTMLVFVFGSLVSSLAFVLSSAYPNILGWIAYSPLMYFDLSAITTPAMEMMSYMQSYAFAGAKLWIGIIYHLIFITLFTWLTVIAFRKTQIKG